jgi:hypothetical protein
MVTIKVISERGVEDKRIPQCFADLQWIDYVEAICADKENEPVVGVLSALTGIPVDDFELMSIENQSFILNACSFFWDESPEYIEVPDSVKELSIAQGTWQQLIDCESEFTRVAKLEKPQIAAAQMIIKTYANVDIKGMRVPEALGYWSFFFCSLNNGRNGGRICTTTNQTTMRKPQGLQRFRLLDGSPRSMHSQKGMYSSTNRYSTKKPSTSIQPYSSKRLNANILRTCSVIIYRQKRMNES